VLPKSVLKKDLSPSLIEALENCDQLPSPPGIAEKILSLAEDPSSSINDFANVVRECGGPWRWVVSMYS